MCVSAGSSGAGSVRSGSASGPNLFVSCSGGLAEPDAGSSALLPLTVTDAGALTGRRGQINGASSGMARTALSRTRLNPSDTGASLNPLMAAVFSETQLRRSPIAAFISASVSRMATSSSFKIAACPGVGLFL